MPETYCYYHHTAPGNPCVDGNVSAWVVDRAIPGVKLRGAIYNNEDSYPHEPRAGDKVYIVDFSFDRETIENLVALDVEVINIDHHEGMFDLLSSLQGQMFRYEFDNNESGCSLTWRHFNPGKPVPDFMRYITANDIRSPFYYENYDECKAITSQFWKMKHTFEMYNFYSEMSREEILTMFLSDGMKEWEKRKERILEITKGVEFTSIFGIENVPYFKLLKKDWSLRSDICEMYHMAHPEQYKVALYSDRKQLDFGLRSDKRFPGFASNCIEIAKTFGGGGHRNASGFSRREKEFNVDLSKNSFLIK